MSHDGTILYIPERGIQAEAAGHHPQCVPGCFVSSVHVEQVLKAIQTVDASGSPVFGIGPPLGTVNPSVIKYAKIAPKESKSAIIMTVAAHFIGPFYIVCLISQRASIKALHLSKWSGRMREYHGSVLKWSRAFSSKAGSRRTESCTSSIVLLRTPSILL
jgi:hypothetical protein